MSLAIRSAHAAHPGPVLLAGQSLRHLLEQRRQILGVFLLHFKDVLDYLPDGRVVIAEPAGNFRIGFNRNLAANRSSFSIDVRPVPSAYSEWLREANSSGLKIGRAVELRDAPRDPVRVLLLLSRMLQEFGFGAIGIDP